mmetsp:Transcript_12460/g.17227  ORF Transcript_12460/g.17227 Transcript_12460/m.17227 type:complete len:165 (+) Transcript_12460:814-1308(+)
MKDKSYQAINKSITMALGMSFTLYCSLGILSLYMFGSNIEANVLHNVDEESNTSSYIIRFTFLVVLACHIPYIFFFGKEGLLIFIDECLNKSMSKELDQKIIENSIKRQEATNSYESSTINGDNDSSFKDSTVINSEIDHDTVISDDEGPSRYNIQNHSAQRDD